MIRTKKKPEHYVDNKRFLLAMTEYRKDCKRAERSKQQKPLVTDYIGECFFKDCESPIIQTELYKLYI